MSYDPAYNFVMMYVLRALLLCLATVSFSTSVFADTSCQCTQLACDPCHVQQGITFYTSKCGPNDSQVKSCTRPTCVELTEATKACPVLPSQQQAKAQASATSARQPASVAQPKEIAGHFAIVRGEVQLKQSDGKMLKAVQGAPVSEGDSIITGADGAAMIEFNGGNKLHVHRATEVKISQFQNENIPELRKEFLNLVKGKIRNDVEQKYNNSTSYYRVKTKAAVAGVRGTIFVMDARQGDHFETRVETLRGNVMLSSLDGHDSRDVPVGTGVLYVSDVAGDAGDFTPVYKIPEQRMIALEKSSQVQATEAQNRVPASVSPICQKPAGDFNQCAWTCRNNPKHAKSCRLDLPKVSCVRLRCNGNGRWSEETRIPASVADPTDCPAKGYLVKPCDY